MRRALILLALFAAPLAAAEQDTKVYELRIYYAEDGKLDALHARFRDHTLKMFERHNVTNLGYWVPLDNPDHRLIYLLSHKDAEAAKSVYTKIGADEAWKKAVAESEKNGKLVAKMESLLLSPTDFSPPLNPKEGKPERIFELRTYITPPNALNSLQARFRDHTIKLFERHGMTNIGYWTLADDKPTCGKLLTATTAKGQDKSEAKADTAAKPVALVYLLAHSSDDARKKSFDAFRKDPDWTAARTHSEQKAGGSLTVKDGVKSLVLKPTDYSPMK